MYKVENYVNDSFTNIEIAVKIISVLLKPRAILLRVILKTPILMRVILKTPMKDL